MNESYTPALVDVGPDETALDDIVSYAAHHADDVGFRYRSGPGWVDVTYRSFYERVRDLAAGLVAAGILPGERVALMSKTRLEWAICDYAIWHAGVVTVPIYETSVCGADGLDPGRRGARGRRCGKRWSCARSSGLSDAAAGTAQHVDHRRAAPRRPRRRRAQVADPDRSAAASDADRGRPADDRVHVGHHRPLEGLRADPPQPGVRVRRHDQVARYQCALQDDPSRCCSCRWPMCSPGYRAASCTPRVCIGIHADTLTLHDDLATFQPTLLLAVPRVFEKLYALAQHRAHRSGKGSHLRRGADAAVAGSRPCRRGRRASRSGRKLPSSTCWSTEVAGRRWAASPLGQSAVARRWALALATSSAASGSRCSRAGA